MQQLRGQRETERYVKQFLSVVACGSAGPCPSQTDGPRGKKKMNTDAKLRDGQEHQPRRLTTKCVTHHGRQRGNKREREKRKHSLQKSVWCSSLSLLYEISPHFLNVRAAFLFFFLLVIIHTEQAYRPRKDGSDATEQRGHLGT